MTDWSAQALATPDTTTLEEIFDLQDEGDKEVLRELYEQLLEDGPLRMGELVEAMQSGELDEVDRISHRLKSSFGNLGFLDASSLCNEIMESARTGKQDEAERLVQSLESAGEALVQGIAKFLTTL